MDLLDAFIDARRQRTFAYFEHDCVSLAADWVHESTGADPLAPVRVEGGPLAPRRLLTALRHVRAAGGFVPACDALLGPSVPGRMARRGNVVLVHGDRHRRWFADNFGICTGSHIVAPALDRLVFLPLTMAVAAWRV